MKKALALPMQIHNLVYGVTRIHNLSEYFIRKHYPIFCQSALMSFKWVSITRLILMKTVTAQTQISCVYITVCHELLTTNTVTLASRTRHLLLLLRAEYYKSYLQESWISRSCGFPPTIKTNVDVSTVEAGQAQHYISRVFQALCTCTCFLTHLATLTIMSLQRYSRCPYSECQLGYCFKSRNI